MKKSMKIVDFDELTEIEKSLIESAIDVRKNAYAPYSGYFVGATLLDKDGNMHTGCNVESADYTLTTHAEMLAIDSMVKTGSRILTKIAIALIGDDAPAMPCGLCRQKLSEFADVNGVEVLSANLDIEDNIIRIYKISLAELLPFSFGKDNLTK